MASIKLTNGVLVDSSSLLVAADLNNQLASIVASGAWDKDVSYTAVQDCWVYFHQAGNLGEFICRSGDTVTYNLHTKKVYVYGLK